MGIAQPGVGARAIRLAGDAGTAIQAGLLRQRNRLLGNPAFQYWAARFWPTRPIATRRAHALFDLCAGFVYSQVLFACVRLDVLEHLADGALPIDALAGRIGLTPAATERLAAAAVSLGLLQRTRDGRVALGIHGASLLGNPAIRPMVEHQAMLYRDLADPVALLRGDGPQTELNRFWSYARAPLPAAADPQHVGAYSTLMSATLALITDDVIGAAGRLGLAGRRRWLDVGGGEGGFVRALAPHLPAMHFDVFDLPAVVARARERNVEAGLSARIGVVGGDFHRDPLPGGFDVVSLVRVLHDHDDAAVAALLQAAAAALAPGGRLLLVEPMSDEAGREPMAQAYFGLYLLAMGSGRPRTPARLGEMLQRAGFARWRRVRSPRPLLTSLIVADRAA